MAERGEGIEGEGEIWKVRDGSEGGEGFGSLFVECPEWSVGDVARSLSLPVSSASELLSVLEDEGFLRRIPTRRYRIGWRVISLNQILVDTTELQDEARHAMERGQVIYLDKMQGTKAIRVDVTGVGLKIHGHCSGVGKVLLAHLPWEKALAILEGEGMPARTPKTITAPEELREELEEGMLELCCVAAPIRDLTGEVAAAMSFSIPKYRFEQAREKYRTTLLATTREVSERLGYTGEKRLPRKSR